MRASLRLFAILSATWLAVLPATAHEFVTTDTVVVLKSNGTFQIDMTVDVDALALGVSPATDSAEVAAALEALTAAELEGAVERAMETVQRRAFVRFDGQKQPFEVSFPDAGTEIAELSPWPTVLGTTARLTGVIPEEAREFSFRASRAFKNVHLTILDQIAASGTRHVLQPAEDSPAYRIGEAPVGDAPRRSSIAADFLVLGFEHILPLGLDHILFVLGLFLLSARLKPLLWQVTAFTIAHSATLALSMYDVVSLPSQLVETLIALSIVYVAVENLFLSELKPWRPALVFAFGLLHGLGFAGVLRELQLPRDEFVTALVSFNVGVELGQLAVVALAFLAVGWARDKPGYRRYVVIPASLAIAAVGLFWAVERALG